MAEIIEVFSDIKDTVGKKPFYLLMAGAGLFGAYNLVKASQGGSDSDLAMTTVTGVASYPDAVTNANVIIDTLQNSIAYSEGEIKEEIQGLGFEMKDYLTENFEATNDYINTGIESNQKLMNENFDIIMGSLEDLDKGQNTIYKKLNTVSSQVKGVSSQVKGVATGVSKVQSSINKTNTAVNNMKKQLNSSKKSTTSTKKSTKKSSSSYYTYKTKAGYNTSTSIVDAIKVSTGNYNMPNLSAIAKANGIKNYSGTYSQNVKMLSMLKSGKLKKV